MRKPCRLTPDEAKALARSIEREWRLYAESTDCDITRTANFYALTELAYCSALEGGDAFALLPFIKRPASGPLVLPSNIIPKTSAP